jgi:uncharacterized protein (DUF1684 family)
MLEQEKLLKLHVIEYFESEYEWRISLPNEESDGLEN